MEVIVLNVIMVLSVLIIIAVFVGGVAYMFLSDDQKERMGL